MSISNFPKPRIILPPNKRIKSPKDYDRKRDKKVGEEYD